MEPLSLGVPGPMRYPEVVELLREKSLQRANPGEFFTLASGAKSTVYLDVRKSALSSKGHYFLGKALYREIVSRGGVIDAVAGVALGGCPLASAVSTFSYLSPAPFGALGGPWFLEALYVRKESKGHGLGKLVEGTITPEMKVVLVEDVVTSGKSSLEAVQKLRDVGVDVIGIVAVVDREEGGTEAIRKASLPFVALTTMAEVVGETAPLA
jgi:orotate phosphoribosyltransferase